MTSSVVVDQVTALDLIDQLRVAVPEEVRQAKRINEETTRLVERAQEEAERILARAQEQAAYLIEERELTRAAELLSQQIVAQGNMDADEIKRGADQYAASVLVRLEGDCVRALQSIRRGITALDERHVEEAPARPAQAGPASAPALTMAAQGAAAPMDPSTLPGEFGVPSDMPMESRVHAEL